MHSIGQTKTQLIFNLPSTIHLNSLLFLDWVILALLLALRKQRNCQRIVLAGKNKIDYCSSVRVTLSLWETRLNARRAGDHIVIA